MKVRNITSQKSGKAVPNQFIIEMSNGHQAIIMMYFI